MFSFAMGYRVLLVDDHKIMRDGIRAILSRNTEFEIAGEAETGPEALQFARRLRPEIVLMDIGLPGLNGVETTSASRFCGPTPSAGSSSFLCTTTTIPY